MLQIFATPVVLFASIPRCSFCQYPKHVGEKLVLGMDVYKKAVDKFSSQGIDEICLTPNNGDPLVDKGLVEKMEYAHEKGMKKISFNTNGILLHRGDIVDHIVKRVSRIGISLPGLDEENYRQVFGVDKAKKVEEGLIKLAESKIKHNSDIEICLDFRIDRPEIEVMNDPGMKKLKPYIERGVIRVSEVISEMFNWSGVVVQDDLTGSMTMQEFENPKNMLPCTRTMSTLNAAVLPTGEVRACYCGRGTNNDGPLVIGDITKDRIEDIIQGERHSNLLRRWMEGDVPDAYRGCAVYNPNPYSWGRIFFLAVQLPLHGKWWKRMLMSSSESQALGTQSNPKGVHSAS